MQGVRDPDGVRWVDSALDVDEIHIRSLDDGNVGGTVGAGVGDDPVYNVDGCEPGLGQHIRETISPGGEKNFP